MKTVTSRDGTTIAYDETGAGPGLIMVGGATQQRATDPDTARLASLLAPHFTVVHYDRRGRGNSTDTLPFAVDREIEDIEALIDSLGGSAYLFGMSSGAALVLEATLKLGGKVKKIALYEVPYNAEPDAREAWKVYRADVDKALAEGRKGDTMARFLKFVGMPDDQIAGMRQAPFWAGFEQIAPTIAYDAAALGDEADVPLEKAARVTVPALVMDGGAGFPFMHTTAVALANAIPNGQHRTLPDQTHAVKPELIAPVLAAFFTS